MFNKEELPNVIMFEENKNFTDNQNQNKNMMNMMQMAMMQSFEESEKDGK